MLKTCIILLALFAANSLKSQDFIRMDHLGPEYLPIKTLYVNTVRLSDTGFFVRPIILTSEKYEIFEKFVVSFLPTSKAKESHSFGAFSIAINNQNTVSTYYLGDKTVSKSYFTKLIAEVRKRKLDPDLEDALATYLIQIKHP